MCYSIDAIFKAIYLPFRLSAQTHTNTFIYIHTSCVVLCGVAFVYRNSKTPFQIFTESNKFRDEFPLQLAFISPYIIRFNSVSIIIRQTHSAV